MLNKRDLLKKYNQSGPRYTSYPPATFFDRELQTHRVGSFGAEDVVVLEDAPSGVPNVSNC